MNILAKIEEYFTENKKAYKLYKTVENAEKAAAKESDLLNKAYGTDTPCGFIVLYVPSQEKYTVVFMLNYWRQLTKQGIYLGHFAERGFQSI